MMETHIFFNKIYIRFVFDDTFEYQKIESS